MRCYKPFAAAALLATLAACQDTPTGPAARGTGPEPESGPSLAMNATTSRVVGYFPYWYSGSLDAVRYDKFTHIMYAFADPTAAGGIVLSGDSAKLAGVVQRAHAVGTKVLISVGGWSGGDDSGFTQMASSSTTRSTFVSNVVSFVDKYGLDGVDIDWEYPDAGTEPDDFAALMDALNTAMDADGKLLTAAVPATAYRGDSIRASVFAEVDFLFLMAYDDDYPHSTYAYADAALDYWLDRGLPAGKAVLGVPFYGRNSVEDYKDYREIVRADAQAPGKDYSNGYYYNGVETIKKKTTLSLQRASGVGIWELTQDTVVAGTGLLDAVHQAMNATVPPYDYTRVVYDDTLKWDDWSWGVTRNFASTSYAYQGTKSISVAITAAWGGLQLALDAGLNPANRSKLEFYIHGGGTAGRNLKVYLVDPDGDSMTKVSLNDYVEGNSVSATAWRKVTIPFTALGVGSTRIQRVVIQDGAGAAQPTFYVDYIRFLP